MSRSSPGTLSRIAHALFPRRYCSTNSRRLPEGCVSIPEEARRSAERALEQTSDLLSVSRGSVCALSSPNLPVAFRAGSASEQEWLTSQNEIAGFTRLVAQPDVSPGVDVELVTKLGDRPDGVALLAETVASQRLLGQFREAVRVFERAFARSSDRLVPVLADFLERRPVLGFTKTEVKNWISRIRGRVVHADRHKHEPALEADVRPYTARMILAAYEVVLNKAEWGTPSSERRDLWTPRAGPLDPSGRSIFIEQHATEPPLEGRIWDRFGAYPIQLGAPGLDIPEFWPPKGPETSTTESFGFSVVSRAELETVRLDE